MVINKTNLVNLHTTLDLAFNNAMQQTGADLKPAHVALCYEKKAIGKKFVEYAGLGGNPVLRNINKGGREKQVLPVERWTLRNGTFQALLGMLAEDLETDESIFVDEVRGYGLLGYQYYEGECADALCAAWDNPDYTGTAYFAANKPYSKLIQDKKFTNYSTGNKKLSAPEFEIARANLIARTDATGNARGIGLTGLQLVVGPDNLSTAEKILEVAITNGGDTNPLYRKAEIVMLPHLASRKIGNASAAPAWFLAAKTSNGSMRPLIKQIGKEITSAMQTDPLDSNAMMNDEYLFKVSGRATIGLGDSALIYGSKGTTA